LRHTLSGGPLIACPFCGKTKRGWRRRHGLQPCAACDRRSRISPDPNDAAFFATQAAAHAIVVGIAENGLPGLFGVPSATVGECAAGFFVRLKTDGAFVGYYR